MIRFKILNFVTSTEAEVLRTACRRHMIGFKWPRLSFPLIILKASLVSRVPVLSVKIKFHEIKNISRNKRVNWRREFLRKIAVWTRYEETFEDFEKTRKLHIFQITMEYILDYSLVQRYIHSFFWFPRDETPTSPSPDELEYITLNCTIDFCETYFVKNKKKWMGLVNFCIFTFIHIVNYLSEMN